MSSLRRREVKKFTFFWMDREDSSACTRKRLRICGLSNCGQKLEGVRKVEVHVVESEKGRCERCEEEMSSQGREQYPSAQ